MNPANRQKLELLNAAIAAQAEAKKWPDEQQRSTWIEEQLAEVERNNATRSEEIEAKRLTHLVERQKRVSVLREKQAAYLKSAKDTKAGLVAQISASK